MIESLEERANNARQSIDVVTSPVADREFNPPRQHVGAAAAVVFAVVLAAAGVWAIARDDGPQAAEVAADGPDAVSATEDEPTVSDQSAETDMPVGAAGPIEPGAFLVFTEPPVGFEPMILPDPPIDPQYIPTFDLYGTPGDAPFANGDLAVASITVPPGETMVDPETPSLEVDGETIYLEGDEDGFNVVSWFQGETGTGLLSQSLSQDELVELMTEYVRTGELRTDGLTLLQEDGALSYSLGGMDGTVVYQPTADGATSDSEAIGVIIIHSAPAESGLLLEWFRSASPEGTELVAPATETISHNGWTIQTGTSPEGGLELRFDVEGVPVRVTMLGTTGPGMPALDDALILLGDIRGATPAEIEAMTIRGGETTTFGSVSD